MKYDPAEAFEKFSFDYLKIREKEYPHSDQLNFLSQKLHPIKNKRILELGCGSGVPVLKYFYEREAQISGIDISTNMISHAKKNLPTGHFIHKDMTQVTLENNYYDAILSFYSLFVLELKNQFLMFEKMYNALKPGGIVYFTLLTKTYTKQDEFETIMEFLGHNLYFAQTTSDKYENQLMKIGFINIKMEELMIGEDETCLWVYSEKSI